MVELDNPAFDVLMVFPACFLLAHVGVRERTKLVAQSDTSVCGRCRYSLAGLDPGAVCPECGQVDPAGPRFVSRRRLVTRSRNPALSVTTFLAQILLPILAYYIARELLVLEYMREGFSAATARYAIPRRELIDPFHQAAYRAVAVAVALTPLASLIRPTRVGWLVAGLGSLGLASMLRLLLASC